MYASGYANVLDEETIIESLVSVLWREDKPTQYLTLTKCPPGTRCCSVSKYFRTFSNSERFWFFRNHPESFIIANDGYVTLSTAAVEQMKEIVENEVIDYFVSVLSTALKMHYLKLVKHLENSDLPFNNYFKSYTDSDCYKFFQNRPSHFSVGMDSYISLPSRNIPLVDEQVVVPVLESVLWKNRPMHYRMLIENSGCCVVDYFRNVEDSERFWFFRKHPESFVIKSDGYVTLSSLAVENFKEEEENEVIEYFVSVLNTAYKMHYLKLIEHLETSGSHLKNYFNCYSNSDRYRFFQTRPFHFKVGIDSYVSLSRIDENIFFPWEIPFVDEQEVVDLLESALWKKSPTHYRDLIKTFGDNGGNPVANYFLNLEDSERFWFFRSYPEKFVIKNNGYVTLSSSVAEQFKKKEENEVVDYFVSVLNTTYKMHYLNLVIHLESSDSHLKNYFDTYSTSDRYMFFKNRPSHFTVGIDCYVSLPSRSVPLLDEQEVIQLLESVLWKNRPMHYRILTENSGCCENSCAADYFRNIEDSGRFWFFRNHPESFVIENNGYVTLSLSAVDWYMEKEENEVIEYFVSLLSTVFEMHYLKLVKHLESSDSHLKNYFNSFSNSARYWFFRNRPSHFVVGRDSYVSLAVLIF